MPEEKADLIRDIVVPAIFVLGMFIINAIAFFVIMRKRKNIVYEDFNIYEPIETPTTTGPTPETNSAQNIEMSHM